MARRDLTGAVDFAHLERFAGGDAALIDEVLGLFREQAEVWMRLLDPHGAEQGWRDAAHSLKGSAMAVGAFGLASACEAAETAGDTSRTERERLLGDVRHALDLALADIAAYAHEQAIQSLKG
ncbi:MAG: Hpt domain-containing protein [Caulobacteraceae bacterium]